MPKWYGGSTLNPDELIPSNKQWVLQWERVKRWYNQVLEIEQKSLKQELNSYDIDIIIAFFQNSYHMRDWLLASDPELKPKLDNLFQSSFEMGACRDICNGFKHKSYKKPTHDPDFNLYREYDHFEIEGVSPAKYRIVFADGTDDIREFDLFELVATIYQILQDFLDKEELVG